MKNLFSFIMVGLTFAVLNVATVQAMEPVREADKITLGEGVQPVGADDQGQNPLESNRDGQNTTPAHSTGMSEILDSSGGGANLSSSDLGRAAVDQQQLEAANAKDIFEECIKGSEQMYNRQATKYCKANTGDGEKWWHQGGKCTADGWFRDSSGRCECLHIENWTHKGPLQDNPAKC